MLCKKGGAVIVTVSADGTFVEAFLRSPFAGQIVERFVDPPEKFAELFRLDVEDKMAARAGQLKIVFKPSDRLLALLAALGAGDFDFGVVKGVSSGHGPPKAKAGH